MTQEAFITESPAPRNLLIALNVGLRGSLQSKYRLALALKGWSGLCRRTSRNSDFSRIASRVGVSSHSLRHAVALVSRADQIAERELSACLDIGARIITRLDAEYPQALLDLELPPPVLYVAGDIAPKPAISIVGSRRSDPYGLEVAGLFAGELARHGFSVISGLALGIDAAAHRAALAVNGHTLAVLGCGIDVLYPRRNQHLSQDIHRAGALVTEFPLGTAPEGWRFPIRNRMIAALSMGTLVVRATPRSGSLVTARHALDLARDIFAVPGNVFDRRSVGPNTLIRDGAHPVQHPREVVEIVSAGLPSGPTQPGESKRGRPAETSPSDPSLASLLELFPRGVTLSEGDVFSACSVSIEKAQAALLELEIGGWIERHPGPRFTRSHSPTLHRPPL